MTEIRALIESLDHELDRLERIEPFDRQEQSRKRRRIERIDKVRHFLVDLENSTNRWTTTDEILEVVRKDGHR